MKRARALVAFFNGSTQATDLLERLQREGKEDYIVSLIQDIITRWWSTYSMIQRLLRLRKYVDLCFEKNFVPSGFALSVDDWTVLSQILKVPQHVKTFLDY